MFAPILRNFIADIGRTDGYAVGDLWLLRDIQREGRFNTLHYLEAAKLLHNQFGISVSTYEYTDNKATGNAKDNYHLINTIVAKNPDYPFGERPTLDLYFKGRHFEIQPHELLADANREFVKEVNHLPQALADIHAGLSISQNAHISNINLGRLVVYVHEVLMEQLAATAQQKLTERSPSVPKQDDTLRQHHSSACGQECLISAQTYAITGSVLHSNTPAGRQTFAVILLILLLESEDSRAKSILAYLDNLAFAAQGNEPLASYLLDKLAIAIIESKADLSAACITKVIHQIEQNHLANVRMRAIEQSHDDEQRLYLLRAAQQTMKQAWQLYKETNDSHLIAVIQKTQAVAIAPSLHNIKEYDALREQVSGKGSWGITIAGLMLSVLGIALIVVAACSFVGSLGGAAPLAAPAIAAGIGTLVVGVGSVAAGIGFFNSGRDTGLYQEMKQVSEEAKEQRLMLSSYVAP